MVEPVFFLGLQIVIAVYAIALGGGPERRAALMQLAAFSATMAAYSFPIKRYYQLEAGVLLIDLALLIGLYWLALKSNRIWPMAMTSLQLSSIVVHVARVLDVSMSPWAYAFLLKVWAYPMVGLLGVAVYRHRARLSHFSVDRAWT